MPRSNDTRKERLRLAVELEELLCDWTEKAVHGSPIIPMEEIKDLELLVAIASLEEDERLDFSGGLKQSQLRFPEISEKLFAMRSMAVMDDCMAMTDDALIAALSEKLSRSRTELASFLASN